MSLHNIRPVGGVALAFLMLSSCDNGPSAVETRDRSEASATVDAVQQTAVSAPDSGAVSEPARWTSNSRNTADQNIQRLFERNGAAFSAASADDYVAQAHAFIADPPPGTETLRRANGDTLFYQASTNTFLVATADGVPRTMFKPDEGAAYWDEQKAREASRAG